MKRRSSGATSAAKKAKQDTLIEDLKTKLIDDYQEPTFALMRELASLMQVTTMSITRSRPLTNSRGTCCITIGKIKIKLVVWVENKKRCLESEITMYLFDSFEHSRTFAWFWGKRTTLMVAISDMICGVNQSNSRTISKLFFHRRFTRSYLVYWNQSKKEKNVSILAAWKCKLTCGWVWYADFLNQQRKQQSDDLRMYRFWRMVMYI